MKIFSAEQIRVGDAYSIQHEPINSIDLMERAAQQCTDWISGHFPVDALVYLFCGTGNNGGDGLAIARLLQQKGYKTFTYLAGNAEKLSPDCQVNLSRLEHEYASHLSAIHSIADFPILPANALIIDALFGTGLNRPLEGMAKSIVLRINQEAAGHTVIAIDMPSGLQADHSSTGEAVVKATHTLSFEFYKLAFLLPENEAYIGEIHILPIGIQASYIDQTKTPYSLTDKAFIRSIYKQRIPFSHKGTYGHALIIAGSYGKMGAAVLASKACLHAGAGLITGYIPSCGYTILQTAVPEVMCICDPENKYLSQLPPDLNYTAIGIGPGIGREAATVKVIREILAQSDKPLVLDADALNIISEEKLFDKIPPASILTPHPKEFERLFGKTRNNFERLALQIKKSAEWNCYIVLKGHNTCISTPEGHCFFNSTGNAGMATGGTGDVLTGILTGLIAQGYSSLHAAVLGVYIHGLAGDIAAADKSMESMTASDIITYLGKAFLQV